MGMFKTIGRVAGKVAKPVVKIATKTPILAAGAKLAAKSIPGLGMGIAAYEAYNTIKGVTGSKGVPAMPKGLPALPGVSMNRPGALPAIPAGKTGGFGIPRGPGGKMQLPWNDPSVPAFLKQFALDDSQIRLAMRAPRGYVIVRDPDGQPYPILKSIAQKFGLWKAAKKPPISVRDWQSLKRADRTIGKLKRLAVTIQRVDNATTPGGKVIIKKRKK